VHTPQPSQTQSRAGKGAVFLTLFVLVWDTVVFKVLLPQHDIPFWFKAIFVLVSLAATWGALSSWRQRIKGGRASLALSQDPVPHGVPIVATFQVARTISTDVWQVEAKIESSGRHQSGFGLVWAQDFAASTIDGQRIRAEVTLPHDFPSTESSDDETNYRVTLTLKANGIDWPFNLSTRNASSSELQFALGTTESLGNKRPTLTQAQVAVAQRRFKWLIFGLIAVALCVHLSFFFDLNLWSRAKAVVGAGTYSAAVSTPEFDIRVSNYLINDWALRGRLIGKARVEPGQLVVRIDTLQVQPVGACGADSRTCNVESVSLLLVKDGDRHFSTLAQSNAIAVNVDLAEVARWSLPPERIGTEIRLELPATVEADGVQFKLEIRSAGGTTVYPGHGPRLSLQRTLAAASGASDPCEHLRSTLEMVQADCHAQLARELAKPASAANTIAAVWSSARATAGQLAARLGLADNAPTQAATRDELLLEAMQNESFASAAVLLAAGASPNAHSAQDSGRTALGYAAASNEVALVQQLITAGANVSAAHTNHQGQTVTPLTQALRTDAAAAVRVLVKAGAPVSFNDPSGWTPMHVASYESAHLSLAELVQGGANIDERTPAYRQQTPLQTALQFGNAQTVQTLVRLGADRLQTDNQGQDACAWARFWKRSEEVQRMVCP
jgi:hypothetical protein